jgi:hypothetical protein
MIYLLFSVFVANTFQIQPFHKGLALRADVADIPTYVMIEMGKICDPPPTQKKVGNMSS